MNTSAERQDRNGLTSYPFIPGIITSSRIRSGRNSAVPRNSSASSPSMACSTFKPSGPSRLSTTIWLIGSSSTLSTMRWPFTLRLQHKRGGDTIGNKRERRRGH